MWIIKNPELKRKVNEFFTDEEIHNFFLLYQKESFVYLEFTNPENKPELSSICIAIQIPVSEFEAQYNPTNGIPSRMWSRLKAENI